MKLYERKYVKPIKKAVSIAKKASSLAKTLTTGEGLKLRGTAKGLKLLKTLGISSKIKYVWLQRVINTPSKIFIITFDSRFPTKYFPVSRLRKLKSSKVRKFIVKGEKYSFNQFKISPPIQARDYDGALSSNSLFIVNDIAGEYRRDGKLYESRIVLAEEINIVPKKNNPSSLFSIKPNTDFMVLGAINIEESNKSKIENLMNRLRHLTRNGYLFMFDKAKNKSDLEGLRIVDIINRELSQLKIIENLLKDDSLDSFSVVSQDSLAAYGLNTRVNSVPIKEEGYYIDFSIRNTSRTHAFPLFGLLDKKTLNTVGISIQE